MTFLILQESIQFSDNDDIINAVKKYGIVEDVFNDSGIKIEMEEYCKKYNKSYVTQEEKINIYKELLDRIFDMNAEIDFICSLITKKVGAHCFDLTINADDVVTAKIYTIRAGKQEDLIEILMHNKEHINEEFSTKIFEKLI